MVYKSFPVDEQNVYGFKTADERFHYSNQQTHNLILYSQDVVLANVETPKRKTILNETHRFYSLFFFSVIMYVFVLNKTYIILFYKPFFIAYKLL